MCAFVPVFASYCPDLLLQFGSLCTGTHKIHYRPQQQWDFTTDADDRPVDLSLVLPHYRARSQPTGHQMSMYIHSSGEIKSTICRQSSRTPFFLSVDSSGTAPVTLYLPSDFCGRIYLSSSSNVSLSAGFTNHILPHVRFALLSNSQYKIPGEHDEDGSDEVEIQATGRITLRMWDVVGGTAESVAREALRKFCRRVASSKNIRAEQRAQQAIDWDFLLDD
ncbi:hypothetical protein EDB89DRAFT_1840237 [Lactarius sanguifluus]|nr:hypothetical protein EDB89DRAFT_1840237 [Lactarius sanguifluus]